MPKLKILLPDETERIHDVADEEVTIGRAADNDLQIVDDSVSSHHAVLTIRGDAFLLRDLHSTNGTMVNGTPVQEILLADGDAIRFGKVEVVYHGEEPSGSKPMPESSDQAGGAAASTSRPANFTNSSPFPKIQETKDPLRLAGFLLAAIGILLFAVAAYSISTGMQTPTFPPP